MFIKFQTVDSRNKKVTYLVEGEYNAELCERFRVKIKEFGGDKDLIQIKLLSSDCFMIKNGKNKELQEIIKKFF